jgi:hypothetical protein
MTTEAELREIRSLLKELNNKVDVKRAFGEKANCL